MKIALVRCPWVTVTNTPDIGLAYIMSALRDEGHEVKLFDLNMKFYHRVLPEERTELIYSNPWMMRRPGEILFEKYNADVDAAVDEILSFRPDICGFNVWLMNGAVTLEFARRIKEKNKDIFILFGGPDAYPLLSGRKYISSDSVDLVMYGESDGTVKKVAESISLSGIVPEIPGLLLKKDGKITDTGFPPVISALDALPYPAVDDFRDYEYPNRAHSISFNRGCIYRCEYCPSGMYPKFRVREPERIVSEMEYRLLKYPEIREFVSCDAALNASIAQIDRLSDLLILRGLKVEIGGFAVPHPAMKLDMLKKMRRAGFRSFVYGIESGSESLLRKLGKKISPEILKRILQDTFDAGIKINVDFLVGFPGETTADFEATLNFIRENRRYIENVGLNKFGLLPYSRISEEKGLADIVPEPVIVERIDRFEACIKELALGETVISGFNRAQEKKDA